MPMRLSLMGRSDVTPRRGGVPPATAGCPDGCERLGAGRAQAPIADSEGQGAHEPDSCENGP